VPVHRSDIEIQKDVDTALMNDPVVEFYEINARVKDGEVRLTGEVESWAEKILCEDVVKGVVGVKAVENEIDVHYEFDRPDREIREEIIGHLDSDIYVNRDMLTVQVHRGEVKLIGQVGSATEKTLASADSWVPGVTSVDASEVEVKHWLRDEMQRKDKHTPLSDEKIERAVKDAFIFDPRVLSSDLKVDVQEGVATLSGIVPNLRAKNAAQEDARNTVGVWRVKNHIKVRVDNPPADDVIAQNVRSAIGRDPYLTRHDIDVHVLNGKVILTGTVDWFFKKVQAEKVASRVKGVVEVQNNIRSNASWIWKADWEIEQDVEEELYWNPVTSHERIKVKVQDGVVTLSGDVYDLHERRAAEEEAYEGGAKEVRNHLLVEHGPESLETLDD
jgi:osmotically-inducible protein OsmY